MLNKGDVIKEVYVLEKNLGEGSFGDVWLAKKRIELSDEGILVALKFLKYKNSDKESPEEFIKKVRSEVSTWVKASGHKNIVAVQDGFQYQDDTFVIVSDYAEGGDLRKWLKSNGGKSPSLEKTVEIMSEVLEGLHHLHSQKPERIIHRDLKPDNVLFKNGLPCITDFGVSRMANTVENSLLKGTSVGTPLYISPESLNKKPASRSMDIWSMGVILYEMLTGEYPFYTDDGNIYSLMLDIVQNPFQPLSDDIPQEFQAIVAKTLEKDVSDRLQTAKEMSVSLKEALKTWESSKTEPIIDKPDFVQPIDITLPMSVQTAKNWQNISESQIETEEYREEQENQFQIADPSIPTGNNETLSFVNSEEIGVTEPYVNFFPSQPNESQVKDSQQIQLDSLQNPRPIFVEKIRSEAILDEDFDEIDFRNFLDIKNKYIKSKKSKLWLRTISERKLGKTVFFVGFILSIAIVVTESDTLLLVIFPMLAFLFAVFSYFRYPSCIDFDSKTIKSDFLGNASNEREKFSSEQSKVASLLIYESSKYYQIVFSICDGYGYKKCLLYELQRNSTTKKDLTETINFFKFVFQKIGIRISETETYKGNWTPTFVDIFR